jgi:epidermal growth factor receptor substrate 15
MGINFIPTDEELEIVKRIYNHAGCKRPGAISGDTIVDIFSESVDLSPFVLSKIWNIADEHKSGELSERGLAMAIRLIGWAQKGAEVKSKLVNERKPQIRCCTPFDSCSAASDLSLPVAGPLPTFKGSLSKQQYITSQSFEWPPFTKQSKEAFDKLFQSNDPVDGLLEGTGSHLRFPFIC